MAKKPANDNEKKLETLYAEIKGFFTDAGKIIKDLRTDKASLEKAGADKDAQIEKDRQANESLGKKLDDTTNEVSNMRKALLGAVVALIVGSSVWFGYYLAGHGSQQVAANPPQQAASSTKDEDTRAIAESTRAGLQTLAKAVHELALEKSKPASVVSLQNWDALNTSSRSRVYQDACKSVDWNSVDSTRYNVGLGYVTKSEAQTIVHDCDTGAIVKKAPATIEANGDGNPNAAEDGAVPVSDRRAYAEAPAPSPVINTPAPQRMASAAPTPAGSFASCPPGTVMVRQIGCAPVLRRRR